MLISILDSFDIAFERGAEQTYEHNRAKRKYLGRLDLPASGYFART